MQTVSTRWLLRDKLAARTYNGVLPEGFAAVAIERGFQGHVRLACGEGSQAVHSEEQVGVDLDFHALDRIYGEDLGWHSVPSAAHARLTLEFEIRDSFFFFFFLPPAAQFFCRLQALSLQSSL